MCAPASASAGSACAVALAAGTEAHPRWGDRWIRVSVTREEKTRCGGGTRPSSPEARKKKIKRRGQGEEGKAL